MKINAGFTSNTKNIPSFKGYFAAPLKKIVLTTGNYYSDNIFKINVELQKALENQGVDVYIQRDGDILKNLDESTKFIFDNSKKPDVLSCQGIWSQDEKIFLDNKTMVALNADGNQRCGGMHIKELAQFFRNKLIKIDENIEGGNFFLGKNNANENILLIGKDALQNGITKTLEIFNIKPKNLHVISQPDFHLDMRLRPLNFPNILVNDPNILLKEFKKRNIPFEKAEEVARAIKVNSPNFYATVEQTCKELTEYGYNPIRVPGVVYTNNSISANFMNALVHQKQNGKMIYITNKSDVQSNGDIDFNEIFVNFIKDNVPQINEIKFVTGGQLNEFGKSSIFIEKALKEKGGGVHCLSNEVPDFTNWYH
ncbi:MAG: hypothetical protein PHV68_02480 [Candidatus Gastranaerophilales bacterium]|nr:hypothetical protein [Candidatus Gastranaerophilales bacterium]